MYLPHIRTRLSDLREELYACHPLVEAEARFARKVVQVCDEALHDVFEARVRALRIYAVHVFGDVGYGEVFEDGDGGGFGARGGHDGISVGSWDDAVVSMKEG
jgi:hypothetical protein